MILPLCRQRRNKKGKNDMWKRFVAMLAICGLLAGGLISYSNKNGTRTDGLYYQATGIRPDAQLLTVNGEPVFAEEYFYWLDSVCEYLNTYVGGDLDFSAQATQEMTFGEYAKSDAANTVTLYALVRQMAKESGISLTEEDLAALEAQRQQYISYYGTEADYLLQLQILGACEEVVMGAEAVPFLYNRLYQEFLSADGKLYPGEEKMVTYGDENGYLTAQLLYFPTEGLDGQALQDTADKAADFAAQLRDAADRQSVYADLAGQLGLTVSPEGLTFCPAEVDMSLYAPIAALSPGEVSGVIETPGGYYVALRMETFYESLAQELFNNLLQERQDSVKVEYNKGLYDSIDAGTFYTDLYEAREALLQTLSGR